MKRDFTEPKDDKSVFKASITYLPKLKKKVFTIPQPLKT